MGVTKLTFFVSSPAQFQVRFMVEFSLISNAANLVDGCKNQFEGYMFQEGYWFKMNENRQFDAFTQKMANGKLSCMLIYIIAMHDALACFWYLLKSQQI